MSEQIPAVIYAAKSTKDKHLSIPEQLDDCREMAAEWEVLGEFADENFTAYTGNRGPGLKGAITLATQTAAERGCEVFIVAQHTSRFARGDGASPDAPKALPELWHEWARANVRGRLVENDYAKRSSSAAAQQGEADHNESKRKSKSVRKGLARRARDRGKTSGGPRPFGYRWIDGDLIVVPAEAAVVARIYQDTIAGMSQRSIARAAHPRRHPQRRRQAVEAAEHPVPSWRTRSTSASSATSARSTRAPTRRSSTRRPGTRASG